MKVRLSVQHRKANVKTVVLHSDAVIGRSTDCNLRLASGQVSRKHCQLFIDDVRVAVMDLGSSNGTFLNGDQLTANVEVPLPQGAELEIGPVRFTVEYDDPNADTSIRQQSAGAPVESGESQFPAEASHSEAADSAVETRRPLLVAKAARKDLERAPEGDPLAETVRPGTPDDVDSTPSEAAADELFSPNVTDDQSENADEPAADDSGSGPNLEGSADETSDGFSLKLKPGGDLDLNDESPRMPPVSAEPAEEQADADASAADDDEANAPARPPDDDFMDFLKNLDD